MPASDGELGLETPEVDHLEQLTPLADELAEVPGGSEGIDADEADVLEQAMPVPADEEYPNNAGD
jgi:hypothetical protein